MRAIKLRHTSPWRSILILDPRDRIKLLWISAAQVCIGILDLFGVLLIGGLGALSIQGIEAHAPGNRVARVLKLLGISNLHLQQQVTVIGISASLFLILKTGISIILTRKTLFFLSQKSAVMSSSLISNILSQNLTFIQSRSKQEILFMTSEGVRSITIGLIGTCVNLLADISMLIILFLGLLVVDTTVASLTLFFFAMIGFLLYSLLQTRAHQIGVKDSELTVKSNEKIVEVLSSYRESIVHNRRSFYAFEIQKIKSALAKLIAEQAFMPYISKYVMESAAVLGSLALSAYEFSTKNAVYAVATLSVFIAASSRIAPAALRVQQGLLTVKNSSGIANATLTLLEELTHGKNLIPSADREISFSYQNFIPSVELDNVKFSYPGSNSLVLDSISLSIHSGESIAIVGPSGAGKTTLIDLILGLLNPQGGTVRISNVSPLTAIEKWPGAISYVPQDAYISQGTIRQNVSLGYPKELATDQLVMTAISQAQIDEFIANLPEGLESSAGESGVKMSGGQRQRIGVARALFTSPRLLVLDEATSALDSQTEKDLSDAIQKLKGKTTVIIVAHRLSTVRMVDQVIYLNNGNLVAKGTFDEVRSQVPDFNTQARLMGL